MIRLIDAMVDTGSNDFALPLFSGSVEFLRGGVGGAWGWGQVRMARRSSIGDD